jgi:hypothetical protein
MYFGYLRLGMYQMYGKLEGQLEETNNSETEITT